MTTHLSPQQIVAQVEPVLRRHSARAEAERRLAPEAMAALIDAGVTRALLPEHLGGLAMDSVSFLTLLEELSRIDSAAGWVSFFFAGVPAFVGLLPPQGGQEIFADPRAVCVGAWFPPGTAEPVPGGYRVSGRWAFGSGSNHATWFNAQVMVTDHGAPQLGPDGSPRLMFVFFPAGETEVLDNWQSLGMRGTGSHDFRVTDIFVPEHRVWPLGPWQMQNLHYTGTVHRLGPWLTPPAQACVALGIARAAIDDLIALAGAGTIPSYTQTALADRPMVQAHLARARALVDAARGYVYSTASAASEYLTLAPKLDFEHSLPLALAGSFGIEAAAEAVDLVHACAGTAAIRDERPFQKYFRDVHTLTQHAFSSASRYESVGKIMLGRESDWAFYYV